MRGSSKLRTPIAAMKAEDMNNGEPGARFWDTDGNKEPTDVIVAAGRKIKINPVNKNMVAIRRLRSARKCRYQNKPSRLMLRIKKMSAFVHNIN